MLTNKKDKRGVSLGVYVDQVLPRLIDKALASAEMMKLRGRVAEGLHGRVLEIGFGSGLNMGVLPAEVTQLLAVDPAVVGQKLAADRIAASSVPVEFVGLNGERIEVGDASCDSALCTWTLCTIPDAGSAVREVKRILKPGGVLHFVEHGLAPDTAASTQRWQHRLNPVQKKLFGGCNLDRDMQMLLEVNGFEVEAEQLHLDGPGILGWHLLGTARPVVRSTANLAG